MVKYLKDIFYGKNKAERIVTFFLSLFMSVCFIYTTVYVVYNSEPLLNIFIMFFGVIISITILLTVNVQNKKQIIISLVITGLFFVSFASLCIATAPFSGHEGKDGKSVVIVLGARTNGYEPGESLKHRLDRAYEYLHKNNDSVCIVTGGQGSNEIVTEASSMSNYLIELGVSKDRIFIEDKSTDTEENLVNSIKIMSENGLDNYPVYIVTNTFHTLRAYWISQTLDEFNESEVDCLGARDPAKYWISNYTREICAIGKFLLKNLM